MINLNFENHNNDGNPHSQYDDSKIYKFSNLSTDQGYVKIASFMLANRLYSLPLELQQNVVKHLYLKFSIKEVGSSVSAAIETISLDAQVSADSKTQPTVSFKQFIESTDTTQTRTVFVKQTTRPDLVDSDGVFPAVFEIYVSAQPKTTIAIMPAIALVSEQTIDSVIPLGAIRSDVTTLIQKYTELISNYQSQLAVTENDVKTLLENQSIIYPTLIMSGEVTTYVTDNFDFNSSASQKALYIANKVTCVNAPFDNTTEYFVESRTISSDWINQTGTSIDGVIKRRNNKAGVWSDWKG